MATLKARGQITIVDQNDAVSFQAFIGTNQPLTQIYTKDTNSYLPDWSTGAWLVLTPQLFISGFTGDAIFGTPTGAPTKATIKANSAKWRKDGGAPLTTAGNYVVGAAAPFSLTVKANENVGGGNVKYEFSAILVDPNNGLETNFSTLIAFNTLQNAGAGLIAVATCPDGVVFKNETVTALRVHCDLYRGNQVDNSSVTYKWGMVEAGVFAPTTLSAAPTTGAASVTLTSVSNVVVGSSILIGATTYTATSVNTGTKVVGVNPVVVGSPASGAAVTNKWYDASLGVNWAKIDGTGITSGITNFTTNEITVSSAAVLNLETFKCVIKDTDAASGTFNQEAFDITTLTDLSDPISIDIAAPAGSIIKNGAGSINLTAKVWQAGAEIDAGGTLYNYTWTRYDSAGNIDGTFVPTTKTVTITSANVQGKSTFECKLMTLT